MFFKCGIPIFQRGCDSGPERSGALDSEAPVAYITVSTASRVLDQQLLLLNSAFFPLQLQ